MLLRHRVKLEDVGGGRVTVAFSAGGARLKVGTLLTPEFIKALPAGNRSVLIEKNFIEVWPKPEGAVSPPAASVSGPTAERHVVPLGFGRYGVCEGKMLQNKPLTRAEAYALAGKEDMKKSA